MLKNETEKRLLFIYIIQWKSQSCIKHYVIKMHAEIQTAELSLPACTCVAKSLMMQKCVNHKNAHCLFIFYNEKL